MNRGDIASKQSIQKLTLLVSTSVLLLTSCFRAKLRDDIKNFISSFSYATAVEEYKEASYEHLQTITKEDEVTRKEKSFYFNRKDENNLQYTYTYKYFVNDELTTLKEESISLVNNEYHFVNNEGEDEVLTIAQVNKKIDRFFYESMPIDNYHEGGMYYGDLLLETAYKMQRNIDIDEKNKILTVQFIDYKVNNVVMNELYHVDEFGMLMDFTLSQSNSKITLNESINVEKL